MKKLALLTAITSIIFSFNALAKMAEYKIIIKNHKFIPENLDIEANKKTRLIVHNQDKTAEEFESFDLSREKIIGGGKTTSIFIGPLKAGTYKYFGEFNAQTAKGTITAK
jgi:hypothetical protein